MRLTPRDLAIIRALYRHRFLRSPELQALAGGSPERILRRLQLLFHHGYLDRPRAQLDWYTNGSEPLVYALGDKGADLLAEMDGIPRRMIRWAEKNDHVGRLFLHHALLVAEIMVGVELSLRRHPGVRLIAPEEIIAGALKVAQRRRHLFSWQVAVRGVQLGVIPDQVFGLEFQGKRCFLFLEADRGTMPVMRRGLFRTSLYRKLLAYHETWRQGIHRKLFGMENFRAPVVTSSEERVKRLVEAARTVPGSPGLFLFTHEEALKGEDFLAHRWMNGKGETVRLLD